MVVFQPMESQITVQFTIAMDNAIEEDERFMIVFTPINEQDLIRGNNVVSVLIEESKCVVI